MKDIFIGPGDGLYEMPPEGDNEGTPPQPITQESAGAETNDTSGGAT